MKRILIITAISMMLSVSLLSCSVFEMVFAPVEGDPGEKDPIIYEGEYGEFLKEFRDIPYETVAVEAFDGEILYGRYYETDPDAPLEIECHGYRGTPITNLAGINSIARKAGRNTLCLEMRGTGRSGGDAITFGIYERLDVLTWCRWANERFGSDRPIILFGISMGAATVIMASALPDIPDNVMCVIADCPYSDQLEEIKHIAGKKLVAGFIAGPLVMKAARKDGGFDLMETTPLKSVIVSDIPLLIIHGDDDGFVPVEMSHEMKKADPSIELEIFPGADHGMSFISDPERYEEVVNTFIFEHVPE